MITQPVDEQSQTWEVADCFFELIGRIIREGEALAQELGVPMPFVKALHFLDCPLAMKELGRRMHCDASFVSALTEADLAKVVDRYWDPPVTMAVRLVSVLSDDLQHAGQAAFIRGLIERRG